MVMNKLLSMIGLATRAGKTVSGEFMVEKSIKSNDAKMVIVSEDASDNTKKLFTDKCKFYNVPIYIMLNRYELGKAVGKKSRVSIAIIDEGFKDAIAKLVVK